jgi:hypothetical protein
MPKTVSYAAYFWTGTDANGATNALRFPTEVEASEYAIALYQRWTAARRFETRPTRDPATHRWNRDTRNAEPIQH